MRTKNIVFSFLAALIVSTSAHAQRAPIDRHPNRPPDIGRNPDDNRERQETVTRRVERTFTRRDQLDLTRFLGRQYEGAAVKAILIDAYAVRGGGRADIELIINRQFEDSRILGANSRIDFRLRGRNRLGQDIRTMALGFTGKAFVRSVSIVLNVRNGGPGGPGMPPGNGQDDHACRVHNSYTRQTQQKQVRSWNECHDFTWIVGDQYCQNLRRGAPGSNPVRLTYSLNGISDVWIFGCEGVPTRP
jgi:hypothetical protein